MKLDLPDAPDEAVGQTLGRYKLMERLGEGGCGVVYVAEQTQPVRRRAALKVIKLGMDTKQVVARFEAEPQALAMMDHPNIAKVLDAGTTETGRPFFVMELVRGIRITEYCDQNKLPTQERLELFIRVCHAIQHAHQKGISHRDIKPSNILVTLHDGVPVPKVIDFGIAKATEGRLTDATVYTLLHQFIGTPAYMSPEQAEMSGLDIDTRSDIYSLGVLLYELLAGSTPFDAKELMASGIDAMRRIIRKQEPVRPRTRLARLQGVELTTTAMRRSVESSRLAKQLRGDLDWIVMKCLEKDRTRRYETANALAVELRRHLNNEPLMASPPSRLYRVQKALRRNKLAFAAASAVLMALAAGAVVSTWLAFRAIQAEASTRKESDATAHARQQADAIKPEQLLLEAIPRAIQVQGPDHPVTLNLQHNLARVLADQGRLTEAEALARQVLPKRRSSTPNKHENLARTRLILGRILVQTGEFDDAEPLLQDALSILREKYSMKVNLIAQAENELGAIRLARQQLSEASVFLTNNPEEFLKPNFDVSPREKKIGLQRLVEFYRAVGKPDVASKWQKDVDGLAQAISATK